jgi:hypothetical protein
MGRMLSVASRFIGHAAGAEASGVDSTRCSASGSASKAVIHGAEPTTIDIRQHVDDTKSQFRQMNQGRTKISIESTLATVRLCTKVTQGPGSQAFFAPQSVDLLVDLTVLVVAQCRPRTPEPVTGAGA